MRSALMGINAAVVGLLLAAFYDPVWTAAIHTPARLRPGAGRAVAAASLEGCAVGGGGRRCSVTAIWAGGDFPRGIAPPPMCTFLKPGADCASFER
jgi:hypothetical protein